MKNFSLGLDPEDNRIKLVEMDSVTGSVTVIQDITNDAIMVVAGCLANSEAKALKLTAKDGSVHILTIVMGDDAKTILDNLQGTELPEPSESKPVLH